MTNPDSPKRSIFPRLLGVAAILSVHLFTLLVLLVVFCSVVPGYQMFFDQLDLELPMAAIHAIKLSYICINFWYLAILFGMPLDVAIVILLTSLGPKRHWILSAYSHLWLLAVILLLFWVTIGMCLPIVRLTRF